METFNIHDAKTHLSRLVESAARGEAFVIAKAGKPLVMVVALEAPAPRAIKPIGFMKGRIQIPGDIDRLGEAAVELVFGGAE